MEGDREAGLQKAFESFAGGAQGLESMRDGHEESGQDGEQEESITLSELKALLDKSYALVAKLEALQGHENTPQESKQAREQETEGEKEPQAEVNGAGMSA